MSQFKVIPAGTKQHVLSLIESAAIDLADARFESAKTTALIAIASALAAALPHDKNTDGIDDCPDCLRRPSLQNKDGCYQVVCEHCGLEDIKSESGEFAIQEWNTTAREMTAAGVK